MPEKLKGGQYDDFLTPMNVGPEGANKKSQPNVANVPITTPPDPLGIVPGKGKKGK